MPSGAKKRKAAKKKLQKKVHNNNSSNKGSDSLSQGSDDPRSYDERDNGGVEVEREGNVEEGGVKNHDEEGAKEVRFVEGNGVRETKKGNNKSSSSSSGSSSSSSDDDTVEERSQEPESGNVEVSIENSGVLAVVNEGEAVEESIPLEESVKEVVSLPQASTIVTENVIESGLKQNVEEILQPLDEKINVASKMENIVEKVIPVVDRGAENISELVSVTVRHDEGLLPQSSGVKDVEGCCANDDSKASETHKYAEQQPLLSSAPITVRRTSWMDCCGLFEVFSGGSSR